MSRKSELVARLGQQTRATQAATDALDEAVAARLGVNRTDLRCLELLLQEFPEPDPATPGRLAARLGLTTGSVTAMLDRLARLGYLTRSPDPSDRRKVIVRPTDLVARLAAEIYGPLAESGARDLSRYTTDQLELLLDFQRSSQRLQEEAVTRVRALPPPPSA